MNSLHAHSLMDLRRLAYRAKRSEAAREVLHDALLETFPEYGDMIRRLNNWTKREANAWRGFTEGRNITIVEEKAVRVRS